jgi:hypothetical protein
MIKNFLFASVLFLGACQAMQTPIQQTSQPNAQKSVTTTQSQPQMKCPPKKSDGEYNFSKLSNIELVRMMSEGCAE